MLEHVYYEILRCFCSEPGEEKITESWISHMVHARVLLEFFQAKEAKGDDCICAHFGFPDRTVDIDPEHWLRFNKDVHHLTYSRLRHTPETKGWNVTAALIPLVGRTVSFMDHVIANPPAGAAPGEIDRWKTLRAFIASGKPSYVTYSSSAIGL